MDEKCTGYSIVLRHAPIPGIGGGLHTFWVLLDPGRNVIAELHGEAVNRKTGEIASVFDILRGDNQLQFYPRNYESHWSKEAFPGGDRYFCGSYGDAIDRWNAASALGDLLNTKNIDYRAFDLDLFGDTYAANSNAMAFTLGNAMGFDLRRLAEPPGKPYLLPGWLRDFTKEYPDAPHTSFPIGKPTHLQKVEVGTGEQIAGDTTAERTTPFFGALSAAPSSIAAMTPTAARRAIETAKADDAFSKRYVDNDRDAVDYMHALHRAAYPDTDAVVGPSVRPDAGDRSAGGVSVQAHDTTPALQALEAAKSDNGFVKRYLDGDRNAFAQM